MNIEDRFHRACSRCGLPLSDTQLSQACHYLDLLSKWNRRISLTSIEDDGELIDFHFVEAFWSADLFFGDFSVADIGAGAGFPGLAAKIYRPEVHMTLIETNFKKCVFLETVARELGLEVTVVHGAAERWPGWPDVGLATIRALQPGTDLLALLEHHSVPLLQFRGPQSPTPPSWRLLREERFPLSARRTVALYGKP